MISRIFYKLVILLLTLSVIQKTIASDVEFTLIFDGSNYSVKQTSSCGDCAFYVDELEEKYFIDNHLIFVLSADGQLFHIYENNKFIGDVNIKIPLYLPNDFTVKNSFIYILAQDGIVYKLNSRTGNVLLKSDLKIIEKDVIDVMLISGGGYRISPYKKLVVVTDIIHGIYYCYHEENLKQTACPIEITKIHKESFILSSGGFVVINGTGSFTRYNDKGVATNTLNLEEFISGEEYFFSDEKKLRGIEQIDEKGVYVGEWLKGHRNIIYLFKWGKSK